MPARIIAAQDKQTSGAGDDVQIKGGNGNTSGAGGSIILQPGLQASTGGNGTVTINDGGGATLLKITTDTATANFVIQSGKTFSLTNSTGTTLLSASSSFLNLGADLNFNGRAAMNISSAYQSGYAAWTVINPKLQWPNNTPTSAIENGGVGQIKVTDASSGGGSFAYTSSTPTALAANTNDLVLTGSAFQRLSASAAYNLTGIAPPTGGSHLDGRVVWIYNVGSFNITFKHSQTSTAANQFLNEGGGDIVLGPNRIVQATYDSTTAKWRVNGETYPYVFPTTDGSSGQFLTTNGTGTLSWTTPSINLASQVTGTLPVANGGTGATTLTGYVYGNGTSAMTASTTIPGSAISGNITGSAANVTGTVAIANGGTGQTTKTAAFTALTPMTTLGDLEYHDGTNGVRLAGNTTTTKQFLSQTGTGTVSTAPAWATLTKSDVGLANVENTALSTWAGSANITTLGTVGTGTWNATAIGTSKGGTGLTSIGTANQILGVNSGATGLEYKTLTQGTGITITHGANSVTIAATGGTGTVTSVGLSMPSIFAVTNSPVTTTGTLTATLNTQTANTVFAGPTTGVAAAPTFRSLVAADLPTITSLGTVTTGVWNATTIALANGGTGATTQAGAANAVLPTQTGNSGKYLTTDGTNVSWGTVSTGLAGSGTTSYLAKFTAGTTLGNSLLADNGVQVGVGTTTSLTRRMTVASGDNGPQLAIRGWDGSQNCQVSFAAIRSDVSTAATHFAIYVHNGTSEVERLRINASGLVGINNNNPSGQLHLNVSATGTRGMVLQTIASQTVNTMEVWNPSNTVLSGITEDGGYFYGTNDNIKVNLGNLYAFEGSGNDVVRNGLWTASDVAATRSVYQIVRSRGTVASSTAVQAEDYIGSYEFVPRASGAWPVTAMVAGIADGGPGTSTVPTRLSFQTGSDASSRKERLVIKSDGANIINPSGDAAVGTKLLQIKASTSHTGSLTEWQNPSGTPIATVDPNANITTQGSIQITSSTTNISVATNNLALSYSGFQRLNCTTACNLTGIAPPSGGSHVDGRMVRLVNVGTTNLTIKHNDTNSSAANRMFCVDLTDIVLVPRDMLEMMYDASNNGSGAAGWRVW